MRAFWTWLTCFLLAVLPVGSHAIVPQADNCSTCGCCVPVNPNPAPVRSEPVAATRAVRAEREARIQPVASAKCNPSTIAFSLPASNLLLAIAPSVPLFQRHCALLI